MIRIRVGLGQKKPGATAPWIRKEKPVSSKLHEAAIDGVNGWQWDDGPIFLGVDGRRWAIDYGKTLQRLKELEGLATLHQRRFLGEKRLVELATLREKKRNSLPKYRFHWLGGKTEEGEGRDPADAMNRLGYGGGSVAALDYYEEIE